MQKKSKDLPASKDRRLDIPAEANRDKHINFREQEGNGSGDDLLKIDISNDEVQRDTIIAGYTNKRLLFNKSCYIIKSENNLITNKYLLSVLNSKLIGFYVKNTGDKAKQMLFPRITMRT